MDATKTAPEFSFASYLKEEFQRRQARNPRYSLRAFARAMKQDPSSISKIINGRRPVGPKLVDRLSQLLGVPSEIDYKVLALDAIKLISDWYPTTILLLTELENFRPDISWIAEELGISKIEVKAAVERLQRLGLLVITRDGQWKASTTLTTLDSKLFTHCSLRERQEQLLRKATESVVSTPLEERDQSAMTFSFRRDDLAQVRTYIKEFRRKLDLMVSRSKTKDSVYAVTVSFFPLTKSKRGVS